MQEEMIYADPQYRSRVLRLFILLALIGMLMLGLLLPYLKESLLRMEPEAAIRLIRPYLSALFLLPTLIGFYLCYYAVRCLRQGRFPTEGTKVIRDTPILYERAATKRCVILIFLAVLLIDFSVIALIYLNRLLNLLLI